ncbi:MAG: polysaccharide deacetylase family protein, partial [Parasporobacterium sp.]|nr:polysaccharide deacetylase family protein [Parasporobacterium sp.]
LNNPDTMKRMASEGHEVACHTYDHTHMGDEVTMDDIVSADNAIEEASGVRPASFRSPGGGTTDAIREYCKSEGMPLYYWSIDTRDWETRDCDSIVAMVKEQAADGDIVLMHNIYESTADAVEQIVPWLIDEGYTLVTTSELVKKCSGKEPVPGVQYITSTYSN